MREVGDGGGCEPTDTQSHGLTETHRQTDRQRLTCGIFDGGPGVVGSILRLGNQQRHGRVAIVGAVVLKGLGEHGDHHWLV